MARNSTGTISILQTLIAVASYSFSEQDDTASVTAIPTGGTTLHLPSNPNSGDVYYWKDADGSCSSSHQLIIAAAAGHTIDQAPTFTQTTAFAAGFVKFDGELDNWDVFVGSATANVSLPRAVEAKTSGDVVFDQEGGVTLANLPAVAITAAGSAVVTATLPFQVSGTSALEVDLVVKVDGSEFSRTPLTVANGTTGDLELVWCGLVSGLSAGPHAFALVGDAPTGSGTPTVAAAAPARIVVQPQPA